MKKRTADNGASYRVLRDGPMAITHLRSVGMWLLLFMSALLLSLVGCKDATPIVNEPENAPIEAIVSSVTVEGVVGVLRLESIPESSGGPAVSVSGNQTVINGGTFFLSIASDSGSSLKKLFIALEGEMVGYYEIDLRDVALSAGAIASSSRSVSAAQNTPYQLRGLMSNELAIDDFSLLVIAADETGVGRAERFDYEVIEVGAGDVQVSLSWDTDSDVDLHVLDPNGDEVYWAQRRVSSGGELDLDSNAGCAIDGIRNENITWPERNAPRGTYTVRVDYWSSCSVPATNYVVRTSYGGQAGLFSGTFTGPGDRGRARSGIGISTLRLWANPTYNEGAKVSGVGQIRGQDGLGCGLFGASRNPGGSHRGVDYVAELGQEVFAVIDGKITKLGRPYGNDLSYRYIEVTSPDRHSGEKAYVVRQFYVEPSVGVGEDVKAGQVIGTLQKLGRRYPGITEHVHVEMRYNSQVVDPTALIPYRGSLPDCN